MVGEGFHARAGLTQRRVGSVGAFREPRDLVGKAPQARLSLVRARVERLDLWSDTGQIAGGRLVGDTHLGQLRAKPADLGLELGHRAPTCAAAREDRHRRERAEGTAHPRRTVARG